MNLISNMTALLMSGITVVSAMDGADGHDEGKSNRMPLTALLGEQLAAELSDSVRSYNRLSGNCRELLKKNDSLRVEYSSAFEKVKKIEKLLTDLQSQMQNLDKSRTSLLTEQRQIFSRIEEVNESVRRFKEVSLSLLKNKMSSGQITGIDSSFFDLGRDPTDTDFQNLFAVLAPLKESVTDRATKNVLNEYYTMAQSMFLVAAEDEKCKKELDEIKKQYMQKHSLYKMTYERYDEDIAKLEALRQKGVEASDLYQVAKAALDAFVIEQATKYR